MKVFTNKKIIQKMTIVLVILMLFNFVSPYCVKAETTTEATAKIIFMPVKGFLVLVADGVMNVFQYLFLTNEKAVIDGSDIQAAQEAFLGEDAEKVKGDVNILDIVTNAFNDNSLVAQVIGDTWLNADGYWEEIPNFKYTPQSIFEGKVKSFNINFISGKSESSNSNGEPNDEPNDEPIDYSEEACYKGCVNCIEKLKTKVEEDEIYKSGEETTEATLNNDKAIAALQIMKKLGCDVKDVNSIEKFKNIAIPSGDKALPVIRRLTNSYYGGQNLYAIFGFNKDISSDMNNYGIEIIDDINILGVIVTYYNDNGGKITYTMGKELDYEGMAPVTALHDMIATWYIILRNIAVVFLLSILVYVGIRIMISSTAADTAKYKKMLVDWVVALCILFVLHYIMAFIGAAIDIVIEAFSVGAKEDGWTDSVFATVRLLIQSESIYDQVAYMILYLVLVIYTVVFSVYYLKRVVYAAFLTLIAPLVALTYPLDRMGDGKSQAFNMWLKEYVANAIIQPVHLLIYMILVSSVSAIATTNPLYAVVVMGAMIPVEKFIREMFGLNSPKGLGNAGTFAGGALAASAFNNILGKPPLPPHLNKNNSNGKSSDGKGEKEAKNKIKMQNDNSSDLINNMAGKISSGTENKPDIDNGKFNTYNSKDFDGDSLIDKSQNPKTIDFSGKNQQRNKLEQNSPNESGNNNYFEPYDFSGESEQNSFEQIGEDPLNNNSNPSEVIDFSGNNRQNIGELEQNSPNEVGGNDYYKPYDFSGGNDQNSFEEIAEDPLNNNSNSSEVIDFSGNNKQNIGELEQNSSNEGAKNNYFAPYDFSDNNNNKELTPKQNDNSNENNRKKSFKEKLADGIVTSGVKKYHAQPTLMQKLKAMNAANDRYYAGQNSEHLKTIGKALVKGVARGALKTAGAVTLGTLGATVGVAAAVSTGDASNLLKMGGAGALAGVQGGSKLGNSAYELAEGVVTSGINDAKNVRQMYKEDMYAHNEAYRNQQDEKEKQKFARSKEVRSAFKQRFGKMENSQIEKYVSDCKKFGINNLDTMLNCYGIEQGIAAEGHKFAKPNDISHDQAMIAGKISEEYDSNNSNARTSKRDELKMRIASGIHANSVDNNGNYTCSQTKAAKLAKDPANNTMEIADMIQGKSYKEAKQLSQQSNFNEEHKKVKEREELIETENLKHEQKAKYEEKQLLKQKAEESARRAEETRQKLKQKAEDNARRREINNRPL